MAVELLGSGFVHSSTNSPSFNYACHSGNDRMLVAVVMIKGSGTDINGVTYSGISLELSSLGSYGDFKYRSCYMRDANYPSIGSHALACATSGTNPRISLTVLEVQNAIQGLYNVDDGDDQAGWCDLDQTPTTQGACIFSCAASSSTTDMLKNIEGAETPVYSNVKVETDTGFSSDWVIHPSANECTCQYRLPAAYEMFGVSVKIETTVNPYLSNALFFGAGP